MTHDPYRDLVRAPEELAFDARRTALLIVGMQSLWAHPDGWMGRLARDQGRPGHLAERFACVADAIAHTGRLLDGCRRAGIEPLHVRTAFRTRDVRDGGRQMFDRLDTTPLTAFDYAFVETLTPIGDELVIDCTSVSAFNSTPIDQILRNLGRDRLWICGVSTEGSVELTLRDAADRGYATTLATDACASSSRAAHDDAVRRLTGGGIRGEDVDRLLAIVEGGGGR
jgi:nicotinamidase-related amidase